MVCGGYFCTKNALSALNILYVVSNEPLCISGTFFGRGSTSQLAAIRNAPQARRVQTVDHFFSPPRTASSCECSQQVRVIVRVRFSGAVSGFASKEMRSMSDTEEDNKTPFREHVLGKMSVKT